MKRYFQAIRWALRLFWRNRLRTFPAALVAAAGACALILFSGIALGVHNRMVSNAVSFIAGDWQVNSPLDLRRSADGISLDQFPLGQDELIARVEKSLPGSMCILRRRTGALVELSGVNDNFPVMVIGTDLLRESQASGLLSKIQAGSLPQKGRPQVLVGAELAARLRLSPGQTMEMLMQKADDFEGVTLEVSGLFRAPMSSFDRNHLIMDYEALSAMTGFTNPGEASIFLRPLSGTGTATPTSQIREILCSEFPSSCPVTSWSEIMPDLVRLMALNDLSMDLVSGLVALLVLLSVGAAMMTVIRDRLGATAFMLALGLEKRVLAWLMFAETMITGLAGIVLGALTGSLLVLWLGSRGIDLVWFLEHNPYFAFNMTIYPSLEAAPFLKVGIGLFLALALAGAVHSSRVFAVQPAQVMRDYR